MCGIAGIFSYQELSHEINVTELVKIRDSMESRGPDGLGLWFSPNRRLGLAHRRLAIIDLTEHGSQPMSYGFGRFQIVFNGEIYNYKTLRLNLERLGHRFFSNTDTEVLVAMYAEYGQGMLSHIRGMFAFAIWDSSNNSLFLARDPFGIKPLYYSSVKGVFRFSSQVKALLNGGGVDYQINPAGHVGFFLLGSVPEPHTLYKNISSMRAGTSMMVNSRGVVENIYYSFADEVQRAYEIATPQSEGEMIERFSSAFKESIEQHLISDVPAGLFLSSGLDSSIIAALAAENNMPPMHAVTIGFADYANSVFDEVILARKFAKKYNIQHSFEYITQDEFINMKDEIFDAMDQPTIDGINSYFVCKAASKLGIKVALSGLGGDELLSGYSTFLQVPKVHNIARPINCLKDYFFDAKPLNSPISRKFLGPKYSSLFKYGGSYSGAYLLSRGLYMPWELFTVLDPDIAIDGWRELNLFQNLEKTMVGLSGSTLKIMSLESCWYMRNQLLRDIDWASMACSLEVRTPFVDVELYRAILPLIISKFSPNKSTMSLATKVPISQEMTLRKKLGFMVPMDRWMRVGDNNQKVKGARTWAKQLHTKFQ